MNFVSGGRLTGGGVGGLGVVGFRHYSNNGRFGKTHLVMRSKNSNSDNFDNMISKKNQGQNIKKIAPEYKPKSPNQELYYKYLNDPGIPIVFGIGPAGCGKTLLACVTAIEELRRGNIQKIILTRPIVPVEEEELGFLPGNLIHKMDPWTRPIFDIFLEFYQQRDLDSMLQTGVIEISPLAYMRGRTFKRSFIIADEMQNSSPNQMLMMTTRIGENSRMIITGDLKQSDRGENNGLADFMKKWKKYVHVHKNETSYVNITMPSIRMVEMEAQDIQRSPIVVKLLDIYEGNEDSGGGDLILNHPSVGSIIKGGRNNTIHANIHPNDDAALIPKSHFKPINPAEWGGSL